MPDYIRAAVSQNIASGAASAQSTAVPLGTLAARLNASVSCYVAIGANPVAVAGAPCFRLAPNWPEVFAVRPGELIAAIQDGGVGVLNITWMTS